MSVSLRVVVRPSHDTDPMCWGAWFWRIYEDQHVADGIVGTTGLTFGYADTEAAARARAETVMAGQVAT